jgi:hypothetical protein
LQGTRLFRIFLLHEQHVILSCWSIDLLATSAARSNQNYEIFAVYVVLISWWPSVSFLPAMKAPWRAGDELQRTPRNNNF